MKIAYLSTFYPFRGGIAQFNAALHDELKKDHEVKAFNFSRQYPNILFPGETQFVTDKDTAAAIPNDRILDTINPFTYLSAARKIWNWKPDVLVTKFWMPFFAPSLGTVAGKLRKKGVKTIAVLDNVIPHEKRPGDDALIRYFLKRYDGYIAMSKQVEGDLLSLKPNANYLYHPHPLYDHFPPPVNKEEARKKLGIPSDKKVLLYFGFIRDYKGLDLLIEAMKDLPDDYHLIIAGESYGSFDKYDELIKKGGQSDRIHKFVRYIDDNEVPLFYSAADVCMLTYKSATQSGIVAIAYHYNLPVIVSDVGGLRESVEPFNAGVVVDHPNTQDIVKGVNSFFERPNFYRESINSAKKQLSWESLASSFNSLVKQLG